MAELLKREYELTVLRVHLDTTGRQPKVRLILEGRGQMHEGQRPGRPRFEERATFSKIEAWSAPLAEYGVPDVLDGDAARGQGPFRIPERLVGDIYDALRVRGLASSDLWVHLVPPYGYLGLVPWERILSQGLHRPVYRLPDFLTKPPLDQVKVLDVAVCASSPVADDRFRLPQTIVPLCKAILASTNRPTRIHVFADQASLPGVLAPFHDSGLDQAVTVHDPVGARPYGTPTATMRVPDRDKVVSPWLLWMRDALEGVSVDCVHFVAHGYHANDRPAIALAESPLVNKDRDISRFVGFRELSTFLTQLGAWSVAFTAPPNNHSDVSLRRLADTFGQQRPGPALFLPWEDGEMAQHRWAYSLLYSTYPPAAEPPYGADYLLYCHPERTLHRRQAPTESPRFMAMGLPSIQVPTTPVAWQSAATRYLEGRAVELRRLREGPQASPEAAEALEAALTTLTAYLGAGPGVPN